MDLFDLITYENESTGLDFKAATYRADRSESLLKDIMAMANADLQSDRYIIVGVKHYPSGEREVLGVEDYVDDASYYQLVHSNIEPDIQFEYFYLPVGEKKVGVFRIFRCDDPPYMIKKDGSTLKRGDSYIRKGTSQMKLMRSDVDRIFRQKQSADDLASKIEAVFECDGKIGTTLEPRPLYVLPSEKAANEIRSVIAAKEKSAAKQAARLKAQQENPAALPSPFHNLNALRAALLPGLTYQQRDVPTLQRDLELVKETYEEDDLYSVYEKNSHKINIVFTNHGHRYIEDCSVEIRIKKAFDFTIASRVYAKPVNGSGFIIIPPRPPLSAEQLHYAKVKEIENYYIIASHIGDLKHNLRSSALQVPLRLVLSQGN